MMAYSEPNIPRYLGMQYGEGYLRVDRVSLNYEKPAL